MKKEKFYITTTLPYINAKPHIGFASEIIRVDTIARYHELLGDEVFFNTGTDEHGQKIFNKSKEEGIDPQEYSDKLVKEFKKIKELLNLNYNNFIRTTDESHKKAAQKFWEVCKENGFIYKKNYKRKYCVGCELEKNESDLDENGRCPLHPDKDLEIIEEENYFFKFSAFQEKLLDFYKKNPDFVKPIKRYNEIKKFVEKGLEDFSISRLKEKMPWGVPVPGDSDHVMYVWFDALVNYISVIGWPENQENFKKWWPAVQICGKDNLRQQAAMWQAMLMAAGIENSKQIFVQGFVISDGQKMSKSLGNVISPDEMVKKYGTDATRYLLLTMGNFGDDIDITWERLTEKYNADLANGLGNLVSRVVKLSQQLKITDKQLKNSVSEYIKQNKPNMDRLEVDFFQKGQVEQIIYSIWLGNKIMKLESGKKIEKRNFEGIKGIDKFIEEKKPWELAKTDYDKFESIMSNLISRIYFISELLKPFMPETSKKIQNILETKKSEILFERIK